MTILLGFDELSWVLEFDFANQGSLEVGGNYAGISQCQTKVNDQIQNLSVLYVLLDF